MKNDNNDVATYKKPQGNVSSQARLEEQNNMKLYVTNNMKSFYYVLLPAFAKVMASKNPP